MKTEHVKSATAAGDEKAALKSDTAHAEERILKFWQEQKIFEKTLQKDSPRGSFVFYEGPPTANGKPGTHHLEARAFKDVIPRFRTMQGFHVARKGGWDTHGLPVEIQVEKQLGLKSKKEVESFGLEKFNEACKKSVWDFLDLWNEFTHRIGYWVDQENPYVTYHKPFMESVWHILAKVGREKVDGKDMLYKDYRVVPWCARCGTALSSHELAQGYEDVRDLSVTVAFKIGEKENAYILAWTTTPWTLPGNVGLAVGKDIDYVEVKNEAGATYILAKDLLAKIFDGKPHEVLREMKGSELVGLRYEPLYSFMKEKFAAKDEAAFEKAYKVYAADFVTTTDGTGIVHTAVMYGQDDFDLGTKLGLPKFHLVNDAGNFVDGCGFLTGRFVKEKNDAGEETVAIDIVKDLAGRGQLFGKEKYLHTYPHCWRCKTPLIYYARDSWYIRMSAKRAELLAENEKINWEPAHFKDGRFGEWLKDVKDWAISRERYWGTPLPIWTNEDGERVMIGSVKELKEKLPKRNTFVLMRHGESMSNVKGVISCEAEAEDGLSDNGRAQVVAAAKALHGQQFDVIYTSPFARARETAAQVASTLGFTGEIITDLRLGEINVGTWNGKSWEEFEKNFSSIKNRFYTHVEGAPENWDDARKRIVQAIIDINAQNEGKRILIVAHGRPLTFLLQASNGLSKDEMAKHAYDEVWGNADHKEIDWRDLPHNRDFEIDLHRPYIDSVTWTENGKTFTRVKEVLDVWFDSGAMPFAQHHYPFETQGFEYPADYISEAVDQTRGWFYTLLAVGVLMERGTSYKNVVCLGHILDANGKKMSKSLGNIVDPWEMMNKYGVDALRMWMFSVNRPGDSKNFDEKTVDEIVKKVFNLISNVHQFYDMYRGSDTLMHRDSPHVLDRWIISLLDDVISQGTAHLENFRLFEASRLIRDFVGEFSTWYVRRSRDRFKSADTTDKSNALATTRYVLMTLAKYMAPFTPFYAEDLYKKLGGEKESVHLESWPEAPFKQAGDTILISDMQSVRALVTRGLELRNKANIKVRQPLSKISVKELGIAGRTDLLALVTDELNVKEVVSNAQQTEDVVLDTSITPELKAEGIFRDMLRIVQDARKTANLEPGTSIVLSVATDEHGKKIFEQFKDEFTRLAMVITVTYTEATAETARIDTVPYEVKLTIL